MYNTPFVNVRRVDAATGIISTLVCMYITFISNPALVHRVDAATGIIYTVAGNFFLGRDGIMLTYSGDGAPATNAAINQARGVAVDATGNIFIADSGNNVIRKVAM